MFLAEKGISVSYEQVDIFQQASRQPAFLEKNPLGGLPVLELDDGTFLSESVAICRYFEELHPDPPLFGRGARDKAEIEMWNRRVELNLLKAIGTVWQHGSPLMAKLVQQIPANIEPSRKQAAQFCELLNQTLEARPFLAGEQISIADITLLCSLDFARLIEMPLDPALTAIARWHAAVSSRPSASA